VVLPGGTYRKGSDEGLGPAEDEEGPVREVTVGSFAIGATTVTAAQWREFVEQTGYVSDAQRFGWSHVFHLHLPPVVAARAPRAGSAPWWCAIPGADWQHPEGPGSDLSGRWDHPVVHISWRDANAWCLWAGGRLPTEDEWEYAARGGLDGARYPWGDDLHPDGEHVCNIWQGDFPHHDEAADGWAGTAPVRTYPPNGFGLFQTTGNVWEWCADTWRGGRIIKGGSFLCHASYCNRYRVAARSANEEDASAANAGFRCVWDIR
jgi:formylglycine-generating enzyme required for sulfatase activity